MLRPGVCTGLYCHEYRLSDKPFSAVEYHKNYSVWLESSLSWVYHINYICGKANKVLGLIASIERLSYDLEKRFRQVFVLCFISQWIKRSKHGLFVFPPKKP